MSENNKSPLPDLKPNPGVSTLVSLAFVIGVFLALPISQLIDSLRKDTRTAIETTELKPPEMMQQPPPPEDDQDEQDIEELQEEQEPPSLQMLELSINTDLSAIGNSDFTIPTINVGNEIDMLVYELKDLTQQPTPISQKEPIYPPDLKSAKVSGKVVLAFIVKADGTTTNIIVESSTNPGFNEPAIRAVRAWSFQPGEKDGKAVNVHVRILIPFTAK